MIHVFLLCQGGGSVWEQASGRLSWGFGPGGWSSLDMVQRYVQVGDEALVREVATRRGGLRTRLRRSYA